MTDQCRPAPFVKAHLGLCCAVLVLAACYEEDGDTLPGNAATPAPVASGATWLDPADPETPAAFLSRQSGQDMARIAPALNGAAERYRESPRMIANRILQLAAEMRLRGDPAPPLDDLLATLAAAGPGIGDSIGPVVQHYRVLRDQGRDHATALRLSVGTAP